jgi:hypothetical protein
MLGSGEMNPKVAYHLYTGDIFILIKIISYKMIGYLWDFMSQEQGCVEVEIWFMGLFQWCQSVGVFETNIQTGKAPSPVTAFFGILFSLCSQ